MASDVEIVNQALTYLGDDLITALTDDSTRARAASVLFGPTRDAVLRSHPWNCAVTRQSLPALAAAPDFGWDYQFTLPTNPYCLRVLAINDDEDWADPGDTHKIEGRRVLSNDATCNLRYIGRITDPNEYDALLYQAFAARLAAALCYALTNKEG